MKKGKVLIDEINETKVARGTCAFWWIGQHSFVVKLGETVIYLDPFLSHLDGRQVPPLAHTSEVTNANLILGSHDHVDHIDRDAWPGLAAASPQATFIVPKLLREKVATELNIPLSRMIGLDQGLREKLDGVSVTAIPAAHEFLDVDEKTGLHPYLGFIIEGNGFCLYHAGDTCIYEGIWDHLRKFKNIDLAFLPINGRDAKRLKSGCIGNMTYQEAVDLAGVLKFGVTVPTHYEMFAMNMEDPQKFLDYAKVKYPQMKTLLPKHAEVEVVKGQERVMCFSGAFCTTDV